MKRRAENRNSGKWGKVKDMTGLGLGGFKSGRDTEGEGFLFH